jgi:hypothetical protein
VPKDASQRRIVVKIGLVHPSKGSAAALKRSIMGAEATAADHEGHDLDLVKRTSSDEGAPSHGLHRVATGVPNRHENRKITNDVIGDGAVPAIRFQAQVRVQRVRHASICTVVHVSKVLLGTEYTHLPRLSAALARCSSIAVTAMNAALHPSQLSCTSGRPEKMCAPPVLLYCSWWQRSSTTQMLG